MLTNILESLPSEHEIILRYAGSMQLFERNGMIAYGKWREWNRAITKEEADRILMEFKNG